MANIGDEGQDEQLQLHQAKRIEHYATTVLTPPSSESTHQGFGVRSIAKLFKYVLKFRLLWPVTNHRTAMDSMKILIPVDSSENSHRAFEWYLSKLHRSDNTVIIVHFISAGSDKDLHEKERKMLELQEFYETRLLQHKVEYRWLTGTGATPGEFIVKTAQDESVGMILMGPRGLGKLRKAILGSVSDYVVSKSAVPVLLYKSSSS